MYSTDCSASCGLLGGRVGLVGVIGRGGRGRVLRLHGHLQDRRRRAREVLVRVRGEVLQHGTQVNTRRAGSGRHCGTGAKQYRTATLIATSYRHSRITHYPALSCPSLPGKQRIHISLAFFTLTEWSSFLFCLFPP